VIHQDFHNSVTHLVEDVLAGHAPQQTETKIVSKDRAERWCACVLDHILHDGFPAVLLTGVDITVQKQAEHDRLELAKEQEQLKLFQRFIRDMAHDLRSPMANIKTRLYLLRQSPDTEKRQTHLDVLDGQVNRLVYLLDEILDMARLDELPNVRLDSTDLNALITALVNEQEPNVQVKAHCLELDLEPDLPGLIADKQLLVLQPHL
jgi:signal transduction histidine kinase